MSVEIQLVPIGGNHLCRGILVWHTLVHVKFVSEYLKEDVSVMGRIIIRTDFEKGGIWSGAVENFKNKWCIEFCRNKKSYRGNTELIKMGAIPIDDSWNGEIESLSVTAVPELCEYEQLNLLDDNNTG